MNVRGMSKLEIAIFWTLGFAGALTMVVGKLGMLLFGLGSAPPEDPAQAAHWHRKRRWLAISEMSALPAFATIGVTATIYWNLPAITSVLISMVLGALGFGFLLNAVRYFAKRKIGEIE